LIRLMIRYFILYQSDASSTFFDDDINDKDFQIDSDELVISETDSDTDDYDVAVEKEIDDKEFIWVEPEVEKNSNIILQNIQVNKPNVSESEGAKFLSSRIKEAKVLKTRFVKCTFYGIPVKRR
jgi:hypothetical protein